MSNMPETVHLNGHDSVSLAEVLDRVLDTGVVLRGDLSLSVADVDLIYLGLQVVLCTADRVGKTQATMPVFPYTPVHPVAKATPPILNVGAGLSAETAIKQTEAGKPSLPASKPILGEGQSPDEMRGLAQLVLALVELLRQLMERQAIRRMERGTVTDDEVERLGQTFMQLAERMTALKDLFGLTADDLDLDLGPLGHLLD